ncbi:hypothetical protein N7508_007633 [Penicillium antarcticum]|uniref:uncharacterized protein n=1 Tax=Penicillium antarcticum TaxID=416450 RepID=UPI0023A3F752|nr:uncharacterized protein N7508_007633 [Penicillium antarcticum]KAJ5297384.1 hypothetical protein N7508_007633 [Penicillium antarcticum]
MGLVDFFEGDEFQISFPEVEFGEEDQWAVAFKAPKMYDQRCEDRDMSVFFLVSARALLTAGTSAYTDRWIETKGLGYLDSGKAKDDFNKKVDEAFELAEEHDN